MSYASTAVFVQTMFLINLRNYKKISISEREIVSLTPACSRFGAFGHQNMTKLLFGGLQRVGFYGLGGRIPDSVKWLSALLPRFVDPFCRIVVAVVFIPH